MNRVKKLLFLPLILYIITIPNFLCSGGLTAITKTYIRKFFAILMMVALCVNLNYPLHSLAIDNNFEENSNKLPLGGRIFYIDETATGGVYHFYDASGTELTTQTVEGLATATSYTITGTPTKDKFYVVATNSADGHPILARYIQWGAYGKNVGITTDGIGQGKPNTEVALANSECFKDSTSGTQATGSNTIWTWLKTQRDSNLNGCNDWFIPSVAELKKLYDSGIERTYIHDTVRGTKPTSFLWSSVESESVSAGDMVWGSGDLFDSIKYNDSDSNYNVRGCVAIRSIGEGSTSVDDLENFPITAENNVGAGNGAVTIDWSGYVDELGQPLWVDKVFKVYKSTDGGSNYESIGLDYSYITEDNPVKVLQVYPIADAQNQIKTWMETNGYGKGIIKVDSVYIDTFNANPNSYLKDSSGNWKYDVIFFGTWDNNNKKDLANTSFQLVEAFIKSGHGVIFGHDTIGFDPGSGSGAYFKNFANYIKLVEYQRETQEFHAYTKVNINKKGLFTTYPWYIGEVGNILDVPESHADSCTMADGEVWLHFNGLDKNKNFYLTTYNNCAMIQTGHSKGTATTDEQKIIANLIFFVNQLIISRFDDKDSSAIDSEMPNKPALEQTTNGYKPSATDRGSSYKYYVEAYNKDDTTETGKIATSNVATVDSTTGVSKYIYKYSDEESFTISADSITNENGLTINNTNGTVIGKNDVVPFSAYKYLHIAAIDEAGNLSETATINSECFTIETSVSGDGAITPTINNVPKGQNKTVYINCNASKFIKNVKVDGNTIYSYNNDQPYLDTYSFDFNNIQSNHTVTAEFGTKQYLVATTIENGAIDGHSFVEHGQNLTIGFSPDQNYEIDQIKINNVDARNVDGCILGDNFVKLENIKENIAIKVKCKAIPFYNVHVTIENGQITSSDDADYIRDSDTSVNFTINNGYKLNKVRINGSDASSNPDNTISILGINENKNIEILCAPNQYVINFMEPSLDRKDRKKLATYQEAFGDFPTPKKDGYIFKGWQLQGEMVSPSDIYSYTEDVNLYPIWEEMQIIKTGDQNKLVLFIWLFIVASTALYITRKTVKQSKK